MERALGEMQTLCAGCSKVEPKIFAPPQTPFPGMRHGQNLISWRWSLPLPTNPVWWGSMDAISIYRGNRPTNKQTQPQTHQQTGPITIHCAAKLSAQCNEPREWVITVNDRFWTCVVTSSSASARTQSHSLTLLSNLVSVNQSNCFRLLYT